MLNSQHFQKNIAYKKPIFKFQKKLQNKKLTFLMKHFYLLY